MSERWNDNAFPGTATVYIEASWKGSIYTGSGAIIGRNDVITASHVIYDDALGGSPDWIRVYPSYNPAGSFLWNPNRAYSPAYYSYFTNFDPDGDGYLQPGDYRYNSAEHSESDLAILSFIEPIGDTYGWYGTKYDFNEGTINILGHPGAYGNYLTQDSGQGRHDNVDSVIWFGDDIEVNPGNSGGPIYTYSETDGRYVVGVVSTAKWGSSIKQHSDFIKRRMLLNDSAIGSQGAQIQRFTVSSEGLTSDSAMQDLFVFDADTLSNWNDSTIDAIYGFDPKDYLIGPTYFLDDIIAPNLSTDAPGASFSELFGTYNSSNTVFGTQPDRWTTRRKGGKFKKVSNPAYRSWLNAGANSFEPYETASVSHPSGSGTWLFINDRISGFDVSRDAVLWLDGYTPSSDTPIRIL
jgi:V8-like Glu-specific endopeptidase